ncbi:MAG: UDP-N-acetylmuramoyl-tripeptide--D-alanyl-D-alanine ligase [Calditrichia bacterium]
MQVVVKKRSTEKLYSEEISLLASPEHLEYVRLNLRKIQEVRRSFSIPVVGIAGAEGKTTTKRMLAAILNKRGPVLETPLDCSSASVVTSTLLRLKETHQFAIIELGIINSAQFKLAVEVAEPTIGIVTNIGEAHMANLGDKFHIADAKVELIRNLPANGFACLNIDDDLVSGMESFSPTNQIIKFGFNPNAHFYASDIRYLGPDGMSFKVNGFYGMHLPIYSSTSISNALAAISVARILNFGFEEIKAALENDFQLLPGRGNLISKNDIFILDHSYNATINSINKACESLVQFKKFSRQLILVVGDLDVANELSDPIHTNLGYYLSALPIDVVISVGPKAAKVVEGIRKINHTKKQLITCMEAEQLPTTVLEHLLPHSTILVTGGRSLNLGRQLESLLEKI